MQCAARPEGQQEEVIRQVQAELGPRTELAEAAVSQYLAATVAAQLSTGELPVAALRRSFREDRRRTLTRLYPLVESGCREGIVDLLVVLRRQGLLPPGCPTAPFGEKIYQERVVHLSLERLLINPAAPPLLIAPLPQPAPTAARLQTPIVAVLFDHFLGITHELYPLWIDAYVFSLSASQALSLIGVHTSWLEDDGQVRRAILFDPDLDLFLEVPLETPIRPAAALLFAQSRQVHAESGDRLQSAGIPHLNPYPLAALADDKWACYSRWRESGVQTPPTMLLPRQVEPEEVRGAIRAFLAQEPGECGWVIQPRHGTEGEGVTWIAAEPEASDRLLLSWQEIAAVDDAILRPRIGLAWLASSPTPSPFDLRLHVCWDGREWTAESGYLLVARAIDAPITSVARGGQIRPFAALEEVGLILPDGTSIPWNPAYLKAAQDLAIRSAQALGGFGLAGVDLKFDRRGNRLEPSVLDLNPRPAGLLHAELFATGEAGIATGLWRRVSSLLLSS